jgi:HK97 gp10 family phage protein
VNVKVDLEYSTCSGDFANDMWDEQIKAYFKIAERIRDQAKALVPVRTGQLKNTIRATKAKKKTALVKFYQFITSKGSYYADDPAAFAIAGDQFARATGKYVWWHYFVEYGTYFNDAHPFLRPAAIANFNPFLAEAERAGKRAVNSLRRMRKWIVAHAETTQSPQGWKNYWKEIGLGGGR